MRKEFECFIAPPPKSNTKEDRNEGNEQQKATRYIENKWQNGRSPSYHDNLMCKWINLSNQKHRLAEWVLKNDPTISYILQRLTLDPKTQIA